METFGERLKRLMAERDMSNSELARRIGKSAAYISLITTGKRLVDKLPNYDDMLQIARALDVSVDELAGGGVRQVSEARALYLTDEALMLRVGGEPVSDEDLDATTEEFNLSALRGKNNLIPQNYDEMRRKPVPRKKKPEPHVFKVRISGDCMKDTVQDGEVVWFDTWLPKEPPALVMAVKDEHEGHIKRLVKRGADLWLESDDGWSTLLDEHWRVTAVAFTAQRVIVVG